MIELSIQRKVQELIRKDQMSKAFDLLREQDLSKIQLQNLTIIESDYVGIKNKELKGILGFEEVQIQLNKIKDNLLQFIATDFDKIKIAKKKVNYWKIGIPILLVISGVFIWKFTQSSSIQCPSFNEDFNNQVLVIPFKNVGSSSSSPETEIVTKIVTLANKNKLSVDAQLGEYNGSLTVRNAPELSTTCNADLLVWGTYSNRQDSIYLTMQYYFSSQPDWNTSPELLALKDVTSIQRGTMLKNLDDAIFSLCGVLAIREGNNSIAKKWIDKVGTKEEVDEEILKQLE